MHRHTGYLRPSLFDFAPKTHFAHGRTHLMLALSIAWHSDKTDMCVIVRHGDQEDIFVIIYIISN